MALSPSNLPWRFTRSGGYGASSSLGAGGGWAASNGPVSGSLHSLFPQVSGSQNAAGYTDYRCLALLNTHGSLTWSSIKIYLAKIDTRGAAFAIGLDAIGVKAYASNPLAQEPGGALTVGPTSVTFSSPSTATAGLSVASLAPGQGVAVWLRRTVTAGSSPAVPEVNIIMATGTSPL